VLFEEPVLHDLPGYRSLGERRTLLEDLFRQFRLSFPQIEFQLIAASKIVNAQAVNLEKKCVRLYGGMAFHPRLAADGIAFVLLHETGHHLAPGCRLPWDPRLACECAADRWAADEGGAALLERAGRRVDLQAAFRELAPLLKTPSRRCRGGDGSAAKRGACWAQSWASRRRNLLARQKLAESVCPLAAKTLT
jgi:hypothetical protein